MVFALIFIVSIYALTMLSIFGSKLLSALNDLNKNLFQIKCELRNRL